jgi:hypothetical protein
MWITDFVVFWGQAFPETLLIKEDVGIRIQNFSSYIFV